MKTIEELHNMFDFGSGTNAMILLIHYEHLKNEHGLDDKEIAIRFGFSTRTLKMIIHNIVFSLGMDDR